MTMQINWCRSSYKDEIEEFERTAKEFTTDSTELKTNIKFLQTNYKIAKIKTLLDNTWRKLQNTDSYSTDTIESVQKAIKRNGEPRNITAIINEFTSGTIRLPIAIELNDGSFYLVAGNTRLMVARMLKIAPKIIIINTDW